MIKVSESSSFHPAEVFHVNHPKTNQPALHPAGAGGTAAAAHRRAGPERDHRPGRYPHGVVGGRGGGVGRVAGGQHQRSADPDFVSACNRWCRGVQPVYRQEDAGEGKAICRTADVYHAHIIRNSNDSGIIFTSFFIAYNFRTD